jgi:hypothetical protein
MSPPWFTGVNIPVLYAASDLIGQINAQPASADLGDFLGELGTQGCDFRAV